MKKAIFMILIIFSSLGAAETVTLNQDGGDINTYKGTYDYLQPGVSVSFTYEPLQTTRLSGTINAENLKPDFTYQVKILGKPTCLYGADGNDLANEYIGYNGRWTCADCVGTALANNRNDAAYLANSYFRGDGSECIQGYLVFDYFTTDSNGDAVKALAADSSYHVLFCSGGTCGLANNDYLVDGLCVADDVNGQIERGSCGSLVFDDGSYDVIIAITEESFHQGDWATVLQNSDMEFTIGTITTTQPPAPTELDYVNIGDPVSETGHDIVGWSGLWTWGGGYGGGDDGTLRTIIPRDPDCAQDDKLAYFTMQTTGSAQTLEIRHLAGSQNDGYNLYVKDAGAWEQLTLLESKDEVCVSGECWYTDVYALGGMTGTLEFKVEATLDPIPSWCTSWGLNAFSWVRITGFDCGTISTPEMLLGLLAALLAAPGMAYLLVKRR